MLSRLNRMGRLLPHSLPAQMIAQWLERLRGPMLLHRQATALGLAYFYTCYRCRLKGKESKLVGFSLQVLW